MSKDYYRILGVLDDAEDIVIRAAYKALAQRYHPDKWTGNKDEANKRMSEINEAYGVLSDSVKRKQYDATRENKGYQEDDEPDDEKDFKGDINSEEEKAWQLALQFFPSLDYYYSRLRKLNYYLANTFKTFLLENKSFNKADKVSEKYAKSFLQKYFGSNQYIQDFAEFLISNQHKQAAKKLNDIVKVMGESVTPRQVIEQIQKEFPQTTSNPNSHDEKPSDNNLHRIIDKAKKLSATSSELIFLTERVIDGEVSKNSSTFFSTTFSFIWKDGKQKILSFNHFGEFVRDNVVHLLEGK
jgi:curved DNA-binding protein CbpA